MSIDPNAEGGPPKAVVAEIDVDLRTETEAPSGSAGTRAAGGSAPAPAPAPASAPAPTSAPAPASTPASTPAAAARPPPPAPAQPILEPISSSDIFRNVFAPPRAVPVPPAGTHAGGPAAGSANATGSSSSSSPSSPRSAPTHPSTQNSTRGAVSDEELNRRLKGEYVPAPVSLSDVVSGNMDRPLVLRNIRLSPAPPTSRSSFLSSLLKPFLSPLPNWVPRWLDPAAPSSSAANAQSRIQGQRGPPKTLQEVLQTTRELVAHLDKFGVYDMQRSGVRLQPVRGGDVDEVELVLALKERGRLFLKAGTEVGGGEGGGNVTARIRNALGGAESLELNASIGTKTKSAYQASFTTPVLASPLLSFALQAFSFDRDNTAFASHREEAKGARAKFSAIAPWGTHDLTYEYIMRDIAHLSPNASVSVRELAHPSTKSSISHTWTSDTRDDLWTGTSGRLLKLTNEYAGLPGSSAAVHFFKTVFQSHLSRELYPGSNIRFSLSSFTSSLFPLFTGSPSATTTSASTASASASAGGDVHSHPMTTPLPDRVFLGGPNSMRGWKVGGMGLRDGSDGLGGDLAWAMGLSVFSPIPTKEHWALRLHGFLNVGKVVRYRSDAGLLGNAERLYRNPNVSVGVGLMYRLEPIRIELNVAMPLVGRKGEGLSRGLGIGVGLEFL